MRRAWKAGAPLRVLAFLFVLLLPLAARAQGAAGPCLQNGVCPLSKLRVSTSWKSTGPGEMRAAQLKFTGNFDSTQNSQPIWISDNSLTGGAGGALFIGDQCTTAGDFSGGIAGYGWGATEPGLSLYAQPGNDTATAAGIDFNVGGGGGVAGALGSATPYRFRNAGTVIAQINQTSTFNAITSPGTISASKLTSTAANGTTGISLTSGASIDGGNCSSQSTMLKMTGADFWRSDATWKLGALQLGGTAGVQMNSGFPLPLSTQLADGATAVAIKLQANSNFVTAGAQMVSVENNAGTTPARVFAIDKDGAIQLNVAGGTKPTCAVAQRGKVWVTQSASGTTDSVDICLKSTADTYSWRNLTTGG